MGQAYKATVDLANVSIKQARVVPSKHRLKTRSFDRSMVAIFSAGLGAVSRYRACPLAIVDDLLDANRQLFALLDKELYHLGLGSPLTEAYASTPSKQLTAGGRGPTPDNSENQVQTSAYFGNLMGTADLIKTAMKYENHGNVTGFRGPWCKAFVNMIMKEAGHKLPDSSLRARDSASLGRRVVAPVAGSVFVQPHHTGFVIKPLDGGKQRSLRHSRLKVCAPLVHAGRKGLCTEIRTGSASIFGHDSYIFFGSISLW
eukprot:gene15179-15322_t